MIRIISAGVLLAVAFIVPWWWSAGDEKSLVPRGRSEVVFWHFWGGEEAAVVSDIVRRFNASQDRYWVRPVAMPGNNLDVKLFLAITGGSPPDVVNQDDPILADWAERGAILPLAALASPREIRALRCWLFPAAHALCSYHGQLYGLCNGLDIRALYFNATLLRSNSIAPPRTIEELDDVAERLTVLQPQGIVAGRGRESFSANPRPQGNTGWPKKTPDPLHEPEVERFGFLPNPKHLWSWGIVFGGDFFDEAADEPTPDDPRIVHALQWMASYGRRYGSLATVYQAWEQSLPGKPFPLLTGHYAMIVDGQWRCRDIVRAQSQQRRRGEAVTEYGVCALPPPRGGLENAGWVNGNFFVVPTGCRNPAGAWEFMKFWSGFGGCEPEAARTCALGGWIPVSQKVVDQPSFQRYLDEQALFAEFTRLAASPQQVPRPNTICAPLFDREIINAASEAIDRPQVTRVGQLLQRVRQRMRQQMKLARGATP